VIHAAVQPNGNVIAVTSCGVAPNTGNLWAVHPKLEILSDEDWGQAKAAFSNPTKQLLNPAELNTEVCVVKDNVVHRMRPTKDRPCQQALRLRVDINEAIEGDIVAACGTGGAGFFLATSTSTHGLRESVSGMTVSGKILPAAGLFGSEGHLYLCSIDTGTAILVHASGPWGDVVSMVYHGGELIAFGGSDVIRVTKVLRVQRLPSSFEFRDF
jgi:hypothetical protein